MKMMLFKYGVKRMWENSVVILPDPHGGLSKTLAPLAIEEANNEF